MRCDIYFVRKFSKINLELFLQLFFFNFFFLAQLLTHFVNFSLFSFFFLCVIWKLSRFQNFSLHFLLFFVCDFTLLHESEYSAEKLLETVVSDWKFVHDWKWEHRSHENFPLSFLFFSKIKLFFLIFFSFILQVKWFLAIFFCFTILGSVGVRRKLMSESAVGVNTSERLGRASVRILSRDCSYMTEWGWKVKSMWLRYEMYAICSNQMKFKSFISKYQVVFNLLTCSTVFSRMWITNRLRIYISKLDNFMI